NLRFSAQSIGGRDSLEVTVDVRNTGDRAGDEVVQVYLRDDVASVAQPVRALKAFRRVALGPGEMQSVSFKLGPDSFALYDRQMRRVVEPGTFTVYVGTDSNAQLAERFEFTGSTLVLAPSTPRFH
ncbi:MAG TPA: fibronectin type III-like domain-contianing protein, partial [Gemmatimonadaceae bacterium]|nr:fibronectin type III-like domain-contianing protein [Gemmatimonadaceae bacterium]